MLGGWTVLGRDVCSGSHWGGGLGTEFGALEEWLSTGGRMLLGYHGWVQTGIRIGVILRFIRGKTFGRV